MKTVAILGPTASGKTDLSIRLASQTDAVILSLDSLSVYREIDIASAKPTIEERGDIPHFGIDVIDPDTPFNVTLFIDLYKEAESFCKRLGRPLLIVGGTGFYLKTLLSGISPIPAPTPRQALRIERLMDDLTKAYETLKRFDPSYAEKIGPKDRYRIEKALTVMEVTGLQPGRYFQSNPPRPILENLTLFEIAVERPRLSERIALRTDAMLKRGLIDEVADLEKKYGRQHPPMKAIGIREVLDYFDGRIARGDLADRIAAHTRQLAKRQTTFNRTQFPPHILAPIEELYERISAVLNGNDPIDTDTVS